ncbi:MAG: DUF89 family protein [Clostridia bacterium]|jgi:damage-control phosphatase, subfamily I|nr:DUF89 family protein [Clostridia bacterium]MBT7121468.1 DUF89 family protein [Clostridia bacterium]
MRMTTECIFCSLKMMNKNYAQFEKDGAAQTRFLKRVCDVIAQADEQMSPPEINSSIMRMIADEVGIDDLFESEKREYNSAIMGMEDEIWRHIEQADDKLYRALQYAMTGNYIDFGVTSSVSRGKLMELIEAAAEIDLGDTYERLEADLRSAKSLVYLLDNCGEIVFDKMCIKEIMRLYPKLKITAVVRGMPTYNDVLMADAQQTGLTQMVDVVDNGSDVPGTILPDIRKSTRRLIEDADVVIAKGMGNYETMVGCALNVYYIFLCKCKRFEQEFGLPQYSGVLVGEVE